MNFKIEKERNYIGHMNCNANFYILSQSKIGLYFYVHWHVGGTENIHRINWPYKRIRECEIGLFNNVKNIFSLSIPFIKYYSM